MPGRRDCRVEMGAALACSRPICFDELLWCGLSLPLCCSPASPFPPKNSSTRYIIRPSNATPLDCARRHPANHDAHTPLGVQRSRQQRPPRAGRSNGRTTTIGRRPISVAQEATRRYVQDAAAICRGFERCGKSPQPRRCSDCLLALHCWLITLCRMGLSICWAGNCCQAKSIDRATLTSADIAVSIESTHHQAVRSQTHRKNRVPRVAKRSLRWRSGPANICSCQPAGCDNNRASISFPPGLGPSPASIFQGPSV